MKIVRTFLALAAVFSLGAMPLAAQQSGTVAGRVTSEGGPLASVQVVLTHSVSGAQHGALTGADGRYSVAVRAGTYTVEAQIIGYATGRREGVTVAAGQTATVDFDLTSEAVSLMGLEVFASRAIERRTPVAYTDVDKVQIEQQLGSRDLPMVLNVTPSVYATPEGGGAGDARINVRGFSQRNTAVMINGVPVNDMENGWVYWSNWDGLGDAATSIQLQRGLSAVNLATPSIGGTLNVITDPSAQDPGASVKQEFGSGQFRKTTVTANTGEIGRFALTGSVVRKTGTGIADGLWTDAWAYYVASSFQLNARNRLEFYAVGAPQRHGQRLYALNPGTWSHEFARGLDGYDEDALDRYLEAGYEWNPNYYGVESSYIGRQFTSGGPGAGTFSRFSTNFINERENYFHKPQVNLNYYSYLGSGLTFSSVAYYSGGDGGGTGTYGSSSRAVFDYRFYQRVPNWDATIAKNDARGDGSSGFILRNSVNRQWTVGAIAKLRKDFDDGLTSEIGLDWRTAEIEHFREIRDLLCRSCTYYVDNGSEFWTDAERRRGLGDKINYNNVNDVNWIGAHLQAEKTGRAGSLYAMTGVSAISYDFEDFFKRASPGSNETLKLESGTLTGYQIKGGAMRNLNPEWSVYGNAGYVSKVPIFDGVINDASGVMNPDPKNEKFLSFEIGTSFRALDRGLSFDANLYHTTWKDRTFNVFVRNLEGDGQDGLVNLLGVDARHMGLEASAAYQPNDLVRFDVALSVGKWEYLNDVSGEYRPDEGSGDVETFNFYIADLKVGDAPQTQLAYAVSVSPLEGLFMQAVGKTFGNHYADFSPFDRTTTDDRGVQPWQPPGYTVFDLHTSYRLSDLLPTMRAGDLRVFLNVFNVFDSMYVQDATDNSRFNGWDGDHDADDAEIFLGMPRTFNAGFQVVF